MKTENKSNTQIAYEKFIKSKPSKEEIFNLLVSAGIYNKKGQLTKPYGGKAKPSKFRVKGKEELISLEEVRKVVADYVYSEGCVCGHNCCGDYEEHKMDEERLAKLLKIPKDLRYKMYNFGKFRSR